MDKFDELMKAYVNTNTQQRPVFKVEQQNYHHQTIVLKRLVAILSAVVVVFAVCSISVFALEQNDIYIIKRPMNAFEKYNRVEKIGGDLYTVINKQNQYGIIKLDGDFVVPYSDDYIWVIKPDDMSEDEAPLGFLTSCNGVFDILDTNGKKMFDMSFTHGQYIANELYVKNGDDAYYADCKNRKLNPISKEPEIDETRSNDNFVITKLNVDNWKKYGVKDKAGNEILSTEYSNIQCISDDRIVARKGYCSVDEAHDTLFDGKGNVILANVYNTMDYHYDEKTHEYSKVGIGIIVGEGKVRYEGDIETRIDSEEYYLIDQDGKRVTEQKFNVLYESDDHQSFKGEIEHKDVKVDLKGNITYVDKE